MARAKRVRKNGKGGKWITPRRRLAIYLRDGFLCLYCATDMHGVDPRDLTLDHLVCRNDGGSHHERNLITACHGCNSRRQDMPLARFCGPEVRAHIRRNTRRSLRPFLALAAALLAGEPVDDDVERCRAAARVAR